MARIGACGALVLLILCAVPAAAQTAGNAQGATRVVRHQAPTDRAFDLPAAALQAEFGEMAQKKLITTRLLEGGSFIEFYFVREGTATLVTGGTLANGAIAGGVERRVGPGDVVFIPPGVPHAIRDTTGIAYLNIH